MTRDEALSLADRLRALVNSRPSTPSREVMADEILRWQADALQAISVMWNAAIIEQATPIPDEKFELVTNTALSMLQEEVNGYMNMRVTGVPLATLTYYYEGELRQGIVDDFLAHCECPLCKKA